MRKNFKWGYKWISLNVRTLHDTRDSFRSILRLIWMDREHRINSRSGFLRNDLQPRSDGDPDPRTKPFPRDRSRPGRIRIRESNHLQIRSVSRSGQFYPIHRLPGTGGGILRNELRLCVRITLRIFRFPTNSRRLN
jgi:hypothetical protein